MDEDKILDPQSRYFRIPRREVVVQLPVEGLLACVNHPPLPCTPIKRWNEVRLKLDKKEKEKKDVNNKKTKYI